MTSMHATYGPLTPGRSAATLKTSFGVLYPVDDILAVIDDYANAQQAAVALTMAGIPRGDIDVLEGTHFTALATISGHRLSFVGRLWANLSRLFSDDAAEQQVLIDEARHGHAILVVHARQDSVAAVASGVLRTFQAHNMRHYHRGSIEDLL